MKILYKDGTVADCPVEEELQVLRHSTAHVMAQAIKRLYPHADFAFGPATEKGFFYDVDLGDTKLTDEDLQKIEAEMKKIVKENLPVKAFILPRPEAIKLMQERGEKYKVEHIDDLEGGVHPHVRLHQGLFDGIEGVVIHSRFAGDGPSQSLEKT